MNLLFRDPNRYRAETFDQAVVKLERLMEIGNPEDWAENMESCARDLKPEFHEKWIRYLANPSGIQTDIQLCNELEACAVSELKQHDHPFVDINQLQTYTLKTEGNINYVTVTAAEEPEEEKDDTDDEKVFTQ